MAHWVVGKKLLLGEVLVVLKHTYIHAPGVKVKVKVE
jgi:hypothetical protein